MILQHIFQDKEKWKKDAFNLIKKELFAVKDNRFIQYEGIQKSHLVCVYGKSQVGKTTLILNMIGLKENCIPKVSQTLRGGVEKGNSSTSTAIIYSESETNNYSICIQTLDGRIIRESIECTPDQMISQLQSIRDDVENNNLSNKGILHISLPKEYFSQCETKSRLTILDLPGIESRNILERAHVESLMSRYIPMSSVCIITCNASQMQSLENEELPNGIDWKLLSQRYVVVLTKAYLAGTIKDYFKKDRSRREKKFQEYLNDVFKDELREILGRNNKTEVFPLDLGESYNKLYYEELSNKEDKEELSQARKSVLDALHNFIKNQKGEGLNATINELRVIVEQSEKEKIEELKTLKKNYEDENKEMEKRIANEKIEDLKRNKFDIEIKIKETTTQTKELTNKEIESCISNVIKTLKSKINLCNLTIKQQNEEYFKDKEKKLIREIAISLENIVYNTIKTLTSKFEKRNAHINMYESSIINNIFQEFRYKYENKLYPEVGFFDKLLGKSQVKLVTVYSYIDDIGPIIRSKIPTLDTHLRKLTENDENELKVINNIISKKEHIKLRIEKKIKENNEKIQKLIESIEIFEFQREKDKKTLEMYLNFAKKAYLNQRNDIIKKLNSNIGPAEKTMQLLLLGLIDNDYKKLTSSTNTNE